MQGRDLGCALRRWQRRGSHCGNDTKLGLNNLAIAITSPVHHLHELHAAVDADLRVDAVRVVLDGLQADEQLLGNLLVRLAEADLLHDLPFALRDAVVVEDVLHALLRRVLGLDGREHAVGVRAQVQQRRQDWTPWNANSATAPNRMSTSTSAASSERATNAPQSSAENMRRTRRLSLPPTTRKRQTRTRNAEK